MARFVVVRQVYDWGFVWTIQDLKSGELVEDANGILRFDSRVKALKYIKENL